MQLKKIIGCLFLLLAINSIAYGQHAGFPSAPDPFQMVPLNGEPGSSINSPGGYTNTNGRTVRSSVLPNPSTTLILIVDGQSLAGSSSTGAAIVPTNDSHVFNFNIYDGGLYPCRNPELGTSLAPFAGTIANPGNAPGCSIGDSLVSASVFTDVVVVPNAIGGTSVADHSPGGAVYNRIAVTMGQLAKRGLTAPTGFTGKTYVVIHIGETDNQNGTSSGAMATGLGNMTSAYSASLGTNDRIFITLESMLNGSTNASITGGETTAQSGCTRCRAGSNWDTAIPNTGANRQADGTHLNGPGVGAGLQLGVAADVTIFTNCKNTSC
jgi:hypothetical protein